jgi:23S rRNA pseudouridine1911/1915/1917 synthase
MTDPEQEDRDDPQETGTLLEFNHSGDKIRLDLFLCSQLPGRSRSFIQKLVDDDCIELVSAVSSLDVKSSTTVQDGAVVRVRIPPPRKSTIDPEDIPLRILHEDDDLAVIDKAPGIIVHPSPHQLTGTLVNSLLFHLNNLSGIGGEERPGIVHRLDRFTSGVMVIAKNDLAHQKLSTQFKERTIKKTYLAILRGEWTALEGCINLPIGRSYYNRKRMMVRTDGQGRESITYYRVVEGFDGYAFVEVKPRTGRTHQIRVHMAKIRMPVACDMLYGREKEMFVTTLTRRSRPNDESPIIVRQALHASRIEFAHPRTGETLGFTAPFPVDMSDLLDALREHRPAKTLS